MHELRFSRVAFHDKSELRLESDGASAEVRQVLGGSWRVALKTRGAAPNLAPPLVDITPQRIDSVETGGIWRLAEDLRIQADPFELEWEGFEGTFRTIGELGELGDTPFEMQIPVDPDVAFFGLGERTGGLDKRGRRWRNWTTDNSRHLPDADPLYQAHPFVLLHANGRSCGFYLHETWESTFDLAATDANLVTVSSEGPTFELYLIPGPDPKDVIQRFTMLTGRAPMPPLWAFGFHQCRWSYETAKEVREIALNYRSGDLPLDVLWLDIDYMADYKVFTFSDKRFPEISKLTRELREQGVRTVAIIDPGVKKETGYHVYEEGAALNAFITQPDGKTLVEGDVWPKPAVWPDFGSPDVRSWWGRLHQTMLDAGIDGIWNDMNEPSAHRIEGVERHEHTGTLPVDSQHRNGEHRQLHNLYGYQMCQATWDGLRELEPDTRPFVLTRSGFSGIQKYAWVWTGDNHSWWEHLEGSIPMLMNLGVSGVPFSGADIGGFGGTCSGELLARWTWLGAFYPFMRNHSAKGTPRQEPWLFGEDTEQAVREALRFRYRILPLIYTLAHDAATTGIPPLRPVFVEFPEDEDALRLSDQFMFGPDLLAAPIVRPHRRYRMIYVPKGSWQDFWSGNRVIGEGRAIGRAPVSGIPLLQRAGTALPLTEAAPHTTDAWWETLIWRVVPGPKIVGRVYEDDGDGYGVGAISELIGVFDGRRLALEMTDNSRRPRKRLEAEVLGMPEPSAVDGDYKYEDGVLRLTLDVTKKTTVDW